MTHDEYLERLAEWGMGWLGWTEEELNATTLTAIETAYKGKVKMLQAVFGSDDKKKTKKKDTDFRSFAQTHNAVINSGRSR